MALRSTTAWVGSWPHHPPFCNMEDCGTDGCDTLYFNTDPAENIPCRSSDRCICTGTGLDKLRTEKVFELIILLDLLIQVPPLQTQ